MGSLSLRGGIVLVVAVTWLAGAQADEPAPASPTAGWHKDADCRLVFHAVLEGLYADGVPTRVVDLIIGKPDAGPDGVKRCFVFRCELCHAVYEAFALYQRRPAFNGGGGADTFGNQPIDPELEKALGSAEAQPRVYAMGKLVQPWIKRRLEAMPLADADKVRLVGRLRDLVRKGQEQMLVLRETDPLYKDWMFYGTCQACEAVKTVSDTLATK